MHATNLIALLSLAALIVASPLIALAEVTANDALTLGTNIRDLGDGIGFNFTELTSYNQTEIHKNVLANLASDRITTTDRLEEFLSKNAAKILTKDDKAIYLEDSMTWMLVSDEHALPVEKRQQCTVSYSRQIIKAKSYWAPWHAVSACLYSTSNPAGGTIGVGFEDSISYSADVALSLGGWEGAFGAALGFSITWGYSESFTIGCNVAGGDVVQIWAKNQHGWAWVNDKTCSFCNGAQSCKDRGGWVNAPAARAQTGRHAWGCSAKSSSYLKC